ncbi:MAG: SDR family NAD(P)-dependent oxidoreductase [Candidatus Thiodiazotropha sp. (ex Lucina pensylvanica)]|nr:SDR family NAD(P)-dependent oxidoreductase [Candidatus Thiodiazotropha sp. (ex Lucina pensylvanica)]
MQKIILITGSTDGIGLEAAKMFLSHGHKILLHGRSPKKVDDTANSLTDLSEAGRIESYVADLSCMDEVAALAKAVAERNAHLDVLINNAGILRAPETITQDGLDVRFAVNTIAPYLLTQRLLPSLGPSGRIVNLSSAAQSPVNLKALAGDVPMADMEAYAQSKLALTMWSRHMSLSYNDNGPVIIAVNPGSLLATKMVKEGFGMAGKDVRIGGEILMRAALSEEFESASGRYFDNDIGQFSSPHSDALNPQKTGDIVRTINEILTRIIQ